VFPQGQHRDIYRQPLYFRNIVSHEAVSPCYVRRGSAPYSVIESEFVFVHRKKREVMLLRTTEDLESGKEQKLPSHVRKQEFFRSGK
jgi:hypothetical protein